LCESTEKEILRWHVEPAELTNPSESVFHFRSLKNVRDTIRAKFDSCTKVSGLWRVPGTASPSRMAQVFPLIDQTIPADRQLHLICDNYATHKHPKVQRWVARHPALSSAFSTVS
jgi:hypothetical protein